MMGNMMKMAAVSTIALLLLCCFIASTASQDKCDHRAATGGNLTVPLKHQLKTSERLKWFHKNRAIIDRKKNNEFFIGTKENISENGSLKLTNLNKSNAGRYTPEVFDEGGVAKTGLKSIQLCILDRVPMPAVKIQCPSTNVKFTCDVGQAKDLNFEWFQNNKVMANKKEPTLSLQAEMVEKDSFSCRVFNPVSTETSKAVKQKCWTPKPLIPETLFGINTWIFVGSGGGIVLVLIIIVIVCCIRTRRRKRLQLKDEGELRLAWTNDQQHHHQHNHAPDNHHHHQQQPAGHTGPRKHRSKQHRDQQRPRAPDQGHPQPSPRRPAQAPKPVANVDDEQPPPLPQPRKKAPKTPRV